MAKEIIFEEVDKDGDGGIRLTDEVPEQPRQFLELWLLIKTDLLIKKMEAMKKRFGNRTRSSGESRPRQRPEGSQGHQQ